mgnify:CR=1 FL=1
MKKIYWFIGACVLIVSLAAWTGRPVETGAPRLVSVSGEAQVRVAPDEALLVLGVETWDPELSVAKSQNDARVQQILALVDEYGIPPEHVKTDHISVQPGERGYEQREGYWVRKSIVVTLRDLSQFEDLLTAALEQGATHVHEVRFQTTELRQHKDQARALAVQAAQEKAAALTGELDQKVVAPHEIREEQIGWQSGYGGWWGYRWNSGMSQNVVQEVGGGVSIDGQTVAPGQITVSARVSVNFSFTGR